MTRRYWQLMGGTLIEEFRIVRAGPCNGHRDIDGVIILGGKPALGSDRNVSLDGKDIIIVQTKASTLGAHLLGQAYYSRKLVLRRFAPKSIRTVALCSGDNAELREFADEDGIEVVIDNEARKCSVPVFPMKVTEDAIVVRIKRRLGMYSMGQVRYSRKSLERKVAKPVRAIIHCAADDVILGPLARADGIEVVVD